MYKLLNVVMMTFVKTLSLALIASFFAPHVFAQDWVGADYLVSGQDEIIELSFSEDTPSPKLLHLEADAPRLVLDWTKMNAALNGSDIGQGQKAIAGQGPVRRFRYAPRGVEGLRLVMELSDNAEFAGTQALGNRLMVKFSYKTDIISAGGTAIAAPQARPQAETFDAFAYKVPIPRLKPRGGIEPKANPPVQLVDRLTPPQPVQNIAVHNAFLYNVPIPQLKPIQGPAGGLKTSAAVKAAALDLYTPVKRLFKPDETPYPRTAPHIGAGQQLAPLRQAPTELAPAPQKPVIVIDPGHGGYDPGAIGAKGTKEKLITSAFSKRLADELRRTGQYDIVMTRTKDVYVDHDDRLRLARERGADLFISIHADSTENGKASGASVYTLADRAKNRSKKITHTQNWIVDVDLSEQTASVGDILVDLAQRKTKSHSADFADQLVTELEKTVPLVRNSHRRAGYYVLLAPDVPAVLLELGFLSNIADEKRLNKVSEQNKIMKATIKAINGYFNAKKP
jgi:N-acetylmuramoyl-L-alanine amidase